MTTEIGSGTEADIKTFSFVPPYWSFAGVKDLHLGSEILIVTRSGEFIRVLSRARIQELDKADENYDVKFVTLIRDGSIGLMANHKKDAKPRDLSVGMVLTLVDMNNAQWEAVITPTQ